MPSYEVVVLEGLLQLDPKRRGVKTRALRRAMGRNITLDRLYVAISLLTSRAFIQDVQPHRTDLHGKDAPRLWVVTAEGKAFLARWREEHQETQGAVKRLGRSEET